MGSVVLFKQLWNLGGKKIIKGFHDWVSPVSGQKAEDREFMYETMYDHINPDGAITVKPEIQTYKDKPVASATNNSLNVLDSVLSVGGGLADNLSPMDVIN